MFLHYLVKLEDCNSTGAVGMQQQHEYLLLAKLY